MVIAGTAGFRGIAGSVVFLDTRGSADYLGIVGSQVNRVIQDSVATLLNNLVTLGIQDQAGILDTAVCRGIVG